MLKIPNIQIDLEQNLPSSQEFVHVFSIDRYLNITGGEGGFCLKVISTAGISCMNPPLRMVDDLMVIDCC